MKDRAGRVLPLLCLGLLALQASLLLRSDLRVLDRPLTEDAYYALNIARNIAWGHGATFDGVHPTNGFQPLFTLLTVPLFWIAHGLFAPLRGLLLVHLVVEAAAAATLATIARAVVRSLADAPADAMASGRPTPAALDLTAAWTAGWLVVFLYLAGVNTFLQHWNGLETGLVMFLLAVCWRVAQRRGDAPSDDVTFGIALGLLVLARIDTAILVVVVTAGEAWARRDRPAHAVAVAARIATAAAVVSLPWWIYNVRGFGSLMPTSGAAQQEFLISGERIERAVSAWLTDAVPWIYARHGGAIRTDLLRAAVVAPVAWMLARRRPQSRDARAGALIERTWRFGGYVVIWALGMALWYCVSSWASQFYVRYLAPLIPCATLAVAWAVWPVVRGPRSRWRPIAALAALGLVAVMAVVTLWLHQGRVFGQNLFYADQATLIHAYVPDSEWVAAGQTGTLGYFRPRVLNLDGKVNPGAWAARADIPGYLARERVRWFCDWPWFIDHWFGPDPAARGWAPVARRGAFVLYRRVRDSP